MKQTTCCKDPTSSLFRVKRGLQISKSFLRRPKQVSITFLVVECFMLNIFLWLVGCCPSLHRLRWNCCLHYGLKDPSPFVYPPSTSQLTLFLISLHFFIKKKENRTEEVCEPRDEVCLNGLEWRWEDPSIVYDLQISLNLWGTFSFQM